METISPFHYPLGLLQNLPSSAACSFAINSHSNEQSDHQAQDVSRPVICAFQAKISSSPKPEREQDKVRVTFTSPVQLLGKCSGVCSSLHLCQDDLQVLTSKTEGCKEVTAYTSSKALSCILTQFQIRLYK